jgi:hypothetical protein
MEQRFMGRSVAQFKWETCKAKLISANLIPSLDFHRLRTSLGPPSHSCPESRSESIVKHLLTEHGMESGTVILTNGTYRGKATAKF